MHCSPKTSGSPTLAMPQRPPTIADLVAITGAKEHRVLYAIRSRGIQPLYRIGTTRVFSTDVIRCLKVALCDVANRKTSSTGSGSPGKEKFARR